jgi:hypothetical protein
MKPATPSDQRSSRKIGLVFFGAFSVGLVSKDAFPILIYPGGLPSSLQDGGVSLLFHLGDLAAALRVFRMVTFMGQNQRVRLGNQAGALRLRQKPYD